MNLRKRLDALEATAARRRRHLYTAAAAACGLSLDELLEEAERFLSQPLEDQLAEVNRLAAALQAEGMRMDEIDEIKQTLVREYRPR